MAAIKFLTAEHMKAFKRLGKQGEDAVVVVKFFNPMGAGTWYITEFDPATGIGFGFADLGDPTFAEMGDINLYELANIRRRGVQFSLDEPEKNPPLTEIKVGGRDCPLGIERDLYFPIGTVKLKDVIQKIKAGGHV